MLSAAMCLQAQSRLTLVGSQTARQQAHRSYTDRNGCVFPLIKGTAVTSQDGAAFSSVLQSHGQAAKCLPLLPVPTIT